MDFMVADIYARTYYKGELPKPEEVSNLTEEQREQIVELTLQARKRDDRWIIDFLNESNDNRLIVIGYYIHTERKLQSIGINKVGRQIVVVSNMQSIHQVSGLDHEKTKALMLYDSLSSFEFKYLMEEIIRRKYEVIVDHPM